MSIMDDVAKSVVWKVYAVLVMILGLPLLLLIPFFLGCMVWELINSIENKLYRDLLIMGLVDFGLLVFVVWSTFNNWFRKHLWRLPELPEFRADD